MKRWHPFLAHLAPEQRGQDMVEYALIISFIALCATILIDAVGANTNGLWNAISGAIADVLGAI